MAYFRLENDNRVQPEPAALPKVQVLRVHEEMFLVALIGADGIEEASAFENGAEAVKVAADAARLGFARFDGRVAELERLV